MRVLLTVVLVLYSVSFVYSQDSTSAQLFSNPGLILDPFQGRKPTDRQVVQQFQARFIEETFTRPLLKTPELFKDDPEDGFFSSSTDSEMINSIMAYQLAQELARQDMLGLEDHLLRQVEDVRR